MTDEKNSVIVYQDFLKPFFLGMVVLVFFALYLPDFTIYAFQGYGLGGSATVAFDRMTTRLFMLFNGNLNDSLVWGAPLFGGILGLFFRFISK